MSGSIAQPNNPPVPNAPAAPPGAGAPPGGGIPPQILQAIMQHAAAGAPPAGGPPGAPPTGAPPMAQPAGPPSGSTPTPVPPRLPPPNPAAAGGPGMAPFARVAAGLAGQAPHAQPRLSPAEMQALGGAHSIVSHLTPGEIAIPKQLQTPEVMAAVLAAAKQTGISPLVLHTGSPHAPKNPSTAIEQHDFGAMQAASPAAAPQATGAPQGAAPTGVPPVNMNGGVQPATMDPYTALLAQQMLAQQQQMALPGATPQAAAPHLPVASYYNQ